MPKHPTKTCEECGVRLDRATQGNHCAKHRPRVRLPRKSCRTCGKELNLYAAGEYCRQHQRDDAAAEAHRIERLREKFRSDPKLAAERRQWLTELNRSPEARARVSEQAKAQRIWERGLAKMTPEVRARSAATLSERRLAHIPIEYRELYFKLQGKGYSAAQAARMIRDHFDAAVQRHTNRIEAARAARECQSMGDMDL